MVACRLDGGWRAEAGQRLRAVAGLARSLILAASAWLLPVHGAQAQTPAPAPDPERVLADRVQSFVAGTAGSDNLQRLAYDLAVTLPATADRALITSRRAMLSQVLALFPADAVEPRCASAYYASTLAYRAGDLAAAIDHAAVAAGAKDIATRRYALEFLLPALLDSERIAEAWPHLSALDAVFGADRAALMRAELYLRIGMVRVAAHELAKVGASGRDIEYRRLRLEELIVTEQYDKALSAATAFAAEASGGDPDPERNHYRARAELAWSFAAARTGREAEAERRLEALSAGARPMGRARVDLAMLRLRRGDDPEALRVLLAREFASDYGQLTMFPLLARARVEIALQRRGALQAKAIEALRAALAARLRASLEQWRSTPERSPGVAFLQLSVRRDLLAALCEAEALVGGDDHADRCFDHVLATDACGSLARMLDLEVPTARDLHRLVVPRRGVLVAYVPAPNGSVALVASGGKAHLVSLPSDLPVRGLVRELRQLVADDQRAGADFRPRIVAAAAPLSTWAFPAALRELLAGQDRWTVIGRELLTNLPFEFLPWPDAGNWLGHAVALDYVPSVTLAVAQARGTAAVVASLADVRVLAATELEPEVARTFRVAPVPAAGLDRLLAALPAARRRLVPAADRAALLAACAQASAMVVVSHGRERIAAGFEPEDTSLARFRPLGLVLRDGFFGVEQLASLQQAPWLVVLAACGTARAGVVRGEDGLLFGTSWLAAGARAALSAEGDLELAATTLLIHHLFAELAGGCELAEALRRARVRLAAMPEFEHPSCSCLLRLDRTLEPAAPK